jgi:hypothetical protein
MARQAAADRAPAEGSAAQADSAASNRALRAALTAAWLAVALGLIVQGLIVIARLLAGGTANPLAFLASVGQGITWSVLVCGGVALGTVAGKARSVAMGVIGLLAGPVAWGLAKGVQKALQSLMGLPQDRLDGFFLLITGLKGVEYAILGAALGFMVGKPWARLPAFAGLGLATGFVFAAIVIQLTIYHGPTKMPALIGTGVNEIVFPVGCALVIYAVQRLRGHMTKLMAHT